jgi:hypothetical protein
MPLPIMTLNDRIRECHSERSEESVSPGSLSRLCQYLAKVSF